MKFECTLVFEKIDIHIMFLIYLGYNSKEQMPFRNAMY